MNSAYDRGTPAMAAMEGRKNQATLLSAITGPPQESSEHAQHH